ncbi:MAG: type VI secretion system domain-containing protein, partial [Desulfovibrionaceae bacterium]|nr:type VI secretion system domain-containing protein [Desulfovibrionaceae bacterium]
PAQKCIAQARKLFLDGQHKSAMDALEQELNRSNRNLDKLELRLEQCRLLIQGGHWLGATALADELLTFYKKLRLGEWSINLGMDVLTVARRAWQGFDSEQSKKRLEDIQRQMVLLRPSSAFDDEPGLQDA